MKPVNHVQQVNHNSSQMNNVSLSTTARATISAWQELCHTRIVAEYWTKQSTLILQCAVLRKNACTG